MAMRPHPSDPSLEVVLHDQLHNARVAHGVGDRAEILALDVALGRSEVRMVERVEHLTADHEVLPSHRQQSLADRQIEIPVSGGPENPYARVAELTW